MSYKEAVELLDGIDTCKVKIWLEEGAKLPEYAHKQDACMDLFVKDIELDNGRIIYHTGVHVALPEDYEMEIRPRSGFTNSELIMLCMDGDVRYVEECILLMYLCALIAAIII